MKKKNIRQCLFWVFGIVLLGLVSSKFFFRIDLTSEKRYTLSAETKQILRQLDEPLYVDIYLDGDMPAGFRKLRNGVREMLDDFRGYARHRIVYHLIDPSDVTNPKEREQFYIGLEDAGLRKITVNKKNKDGSQSQQVVFPGAIMTYKDRQSAVNLLNDNRIQSSEMVLNASLGNLEYGLAKTINLLSVDSIGHVAFTTGHGELSMVSEVYDLAREFANYYHVDTKAINGQLDALDRYKAVVIAKPQKAFDEKDKFVIDRYIMRGGKVMWLIDAIDVNLDSLYTTGMTFALVSDLNLYDQLFTYGIRINTDIIEDIGSYNTTPVKLADGSSRVTLAPWLYYPLLNPSPDHSITRNLNPVWLRYASDIDTLGMNSGIRKTVLLRSSPASRTKPAPFMISLSEVERMPDPQSFNKPHRIVSVLLEGKFPSVFRSRNARNMFPGLQEKQAETSVETKMVVVSDGDIARNDIRNTPKGLVAASPLGYDRYTEQTFGNKEFLTNALSYLTDDVGLMNLRNREFQLRLLDKQKVITELLKWQIINVLFPVVILACGGLIYGRWRRYRYGRIVGS